MACAVCITMRRAAEISIRLLATVWPETPCMAIGLPGSESSDTTTL
jgi:hypothetical protein